MDPWIADFCVGVLLAISLVVFPVTCMEILGRVIVRVRTRMARMNHRRLEIEKMVNDMCRSLSYDGTYTAEWYSRPEVGTAEDVAGLLSRSLPFRVHVADVVPVGIDRDGTIVERVTLRRVE